ncbi:2'-5' RNA ligase family protein [Streptomyces tailanensis]|uniref:2'-5' RNA ligase family protein n=1 Tax=Streptomyces tailanensis TaxID=2569858 RepID=UPI00122E9D49|nr:2'-5' RNA ligase family protein [Streptomyces tailanensis]
MKPFEFKAGDRPWQIGTLLHWYVEVEWSDPRHKALKDLVTTSNQALLDAGFPITPVELQWLHITVDQISVPADQIGSEQRSKLIDEVSTRLVGIAPFTVTVGSLLSYHSGVIADLAPDEDLAALHATARSGTRTALGDEACQYQWGLQHLTTAYANPRELHQTRGNARATRWRGGDFELQGAYSLTA